MKEKFRNQKITSKRSAMITDVNDILEEYADAGYRLTLRQLYYQLVARDLIPNLVSEYAKLSQTCVIGRMNGLIDWYMIEDRLRRPQLTYYVDSIKEAINDTIESYRLDRQKDQKYHIEIWTEKDAVSSILKRSSVHYHVRLMVNRGYTSCSAMYNAYNRIDGEERQSIILYVGDHDPSGLDMIRDIRERLTEFGLSEHDHFRIIHVALKREQIDEYDPPPNPAKITDPRAKWYIAEHGSKSWELDALKPDVLHSIVEDAIGHLLDPYYFNKMLNQENKDKEKLIDLIQ